TNIPPIPPTRFIVEPPVVGTEKPLFLLRALSQKKSGFAVLIADAVYLEPVEWCPSARELLGTYAVPRTPSCLTRPVQGYFTNHPTPHHYPIENSHTPQQSSPCQSAQSGLNHCCGYSPHGCFLYGLVTGLGLS